MAFSVTIESDLEKLWKETTRRLEVELSHETKAAAEDGARHSREHHPYQDHTYHLTDTTTAELERVGSEGTTAVIDWPMPYASFVDKGTSRAKAYPFADEAERVANESLEKRVATVVAHAEARMNR